MILALALALPSPLLSRPLPLLEFLLRSPSQWPVVPLQPIHRLHRTPLESA